MLDLSRLTAEQRRVVLAPDGPMLVLAGPGSGKTTVLAARVAYLVAARGVGPRSVLALVFTTSAARQLRARLVEWLGEPGSLVDVSTLHAFGLRVVRHWSAELGFHRRRLAVYAGDEARALLREAAAEPGRRLPPPALAELAARVDRHRLGVRPGGEAEPVAALAAAYEALLRDRGAVDFPAMLALPLRLLEGQPAARRVLQWAYRYLLADEAQDVSAPQYRLLRLLAACHRNLALVADARQAIYGFRGADAACLRTFLEDFPDARTFGLSENFRSTGRIVALANALGAPLGGQRLWTRNPDGELPRLRAAPDERAEAALIVEEIGRLRRDGAVTRLDDVAVLYRTNRQAGALALALRAAGLPYRVRPYGDPVARREVRDALAYLRLAHDPDDAPALARVVDTPPRGLARLAVVLRRAPVPARELPALARPFGPAAVTGAEALLSLVRDLHARARGHGPASLLDEALERSGYCAWLARQPDGAARLGHLADLRALAVGAEGDLTAWLAEIAVDPAAPPDRQDSERLLLATVHAAKGGEWSVVFVAGVDDGLLPLLPASGENAADLDEERRLAFVAVTRPRTRLYLSYSREGARHGRPDPRRPSRFLRELPDGLLAPAT